MSELKPCPHCGQLEELLATDNGVGNCFITCQECGASTAQHYDMKSAIEAWNRRTSQAPTAPCLYCSGRGFVYVGNALQSGPEAQEEPPTEPCPKCNPSGQADDSSDRDEDDEDNRCERCGGEGFVDYFDAPETWGEDCPGERNHLVTCPDCRGSGYYV
jgi:Lar family restriction alleviation protein